MAVLCGITLRQSAFDATIKKTFTKISEKPTRRMKDNLLTEVKKVLVGVNVTGFEFASKYGLIVEVIGKQEFDTLSGKNINNHQMKTPKTKQCSTQELKSSITTILQHASLDQDHARQYAKTHEKR